MSHTLWILIKNIVAVHFKFSSLDYFYSNQHSSDLLTVFLNRFQLEEKKKKKKRGDMDATVPENKNFLLLIQEGVVRKSNRGDCFLYQH